MNCLECRRSLLASPRARTPTQQSHIAECAECARLANRVEGLDRQIEEAARVPVPEALAHRILLSRHRRPLRQYVAAAAVVIMSAAVTLSLPGVQDAAGIAAPLQAVGPTHPAVTAIGFVVDQQPGLLDEGRAGDPAILEQGLKRLGLSLKSDGVTVEYIGRCYMPETECDHIVLNTPDGQVSVILVPDYPVDARVLVADRRMTALVTPAGTGGYIVVAGSPKIAKRTEKLFVKG